jgi:biotin carboxyl carrier protein
MSRHPLEGDRERCDTDVVVRTRFAAEPIHLQIPITIAGMSFGALSGPGKEAIGRGASEVDTSTTTGDGGMTEEERQHARTLVYELLPRPGSAWPAAALTLARAARARREGRAASPRHHRPGEDRRLLVIIAQGKIGAPRHYPAASPRAETPDWVRPRLSVREQRRRLANPRAEETHVPDVLAHITGTVWKIEVEVGDSVEEGDTVVILESMKMEMPVEAEDPGVVKEIMCEEGQSVSEGDPLVVLE